MVLGDRGASVVPPVQVLRRLLSSGEVFHVFFSFLLFAALGPPVPFVPLRVFLLTGAGVL